MNMNECQRYYVRAEGPDYNAMHKAFQWLFATVSESAKNTSALLVVPTKKRGLGDVIESVVGREDARCLVNDKTVWLTPNCDLRLTTWRLLPTSWESGPLLAAYPSKQVLVNLDQMQGVVQILVVPWLLDDIQDWIDTWDAIDIDQPSRQSRVVSVSNPLVVEALKSLTAAVNISSGISHPLDREATVDLFCHLRDAGERFDPREVQIWLVREGGWKSRDADAVKDIAEKVLQGKRLRRGSGRWRNDIVDQLRSRAEKGTRQ